MTFNKFNDNLLINFCYDMSENKFRLGYSMWQQGIYFLYGTDVIIMLL